MSTEANSKSVTSVYTKTYTSFSGCDMVAIVDINLPNANGTTTKITKVLGEMMTISYSIHMDKHPVRSIGSVNAKDYVFGPRTIAGSLIFAQFNRHIAHEILLEANRVADINRSMDQMIVMDELPPFNITISMANEYGQKARLAIYGVRIVNEGNVISVNDVYTENTYQFVATDIEYLTDKVGDCNSTGTSKAAIYYDNKMISIIKPEGAKPVPALSNSNYTEAELNPQSYENVDKKAVNADSEGVEVSTQEKSPSRSTNNTVE